MNAIHAVPDQPDRIRVSYTCSSQHEFTKVFAADITIPPSWDCPRCGKTATAEDTVQPDANSTTDIRTPWDMLMERRTLDTLSDMLVERVHQLNQEQR